MSQKAVLVVSQAGNAPATLRVAEELVSIGALPDEVQVDFDGLAQPIASFAATPLAPGAVGQLGHALHTWLSLHPVVAAQLAATQQNGSWLAIEDKVPRAQSLPWEALQDGLGNFVALRSTPLFSRIYLPRRKPRIIARTFRPPLRVLAVIAAAGVRGDGSVLTGLPELQALLAGLRGEGTPSFALRVLGCDDDVQQAIQSLRDPRVSFRELTGLETLEQELRSDPPDLLHFFCHGFAGDGVLPPRLELATRTDQLAKKERGSIRLASADLREVLALQSRLWLLSLNSCSGAMATESTSLARQLIADTDVPAVVAMREPIERQDAHLFAEGLMREVRRLVAEVLAKAQEPPIDLELARTLPPVRVRMLQARCGSLANAPHCREWTLPVLYVHRDDLQIVKVLPREIDPAVAARIAEIEAQIGKLSSVRGDLTAVPNLPPGVLGDIDARLAALRAELAGLEAGVPALPPVPAPVPPAPAPVVPAPLPAEVPELRANAWTGALAGADAVGPEWASWALRQEAGRPQSAKLAALDAPSENRWSWQDPRVGWGVVLPDRPGASFAELAAFDDAPAAIRTLITERRKVLGRVPIFRFRPAGSLAHSLVLLHDFSTGSSLTIDASPTGVAADAIPQYLLLCGSPAQIPWDLQFVLSTVRFVGRLDLDEPGLERYVERLLAGWGGSAAHRDRSLTWAVHHHKDDITATLRSQLSRPLHQSLAARLGPGARFLDGKEAPATAAALADALAGHQPVLVSTSSHGSTWPFDDPAKMGSQLGLLVDQDENLLDPAALLAKWQPDGAVWLAHACCSAGSKARSDFQGLFAQGTDTAKLLAAVAGLGDRTAPLPRALLGAEKPLRAFIGQVEPTFDWTLRQPETGQNLTGRLIGPLQERLFGGRPVGSLLEPWHGRAAPLNQAWLRIKKDLDDGVPVEPKILYPRLAAADVASTVLLGDPTAFLA